ncbi:MAG: hypothetical protein RLZZ488_1447 [Pseudomonadota bacterium]|jgi:hypothetical protein
MRVERFYHSAPSAAESTSDSIRALSTTGGEFALPARAFPRGLEAAAYALKKRVICPRWWLVGVISQWLSKETEQLALQLSLREGDWILSGPPLSVKSFPTVVTLWTEIFAQVSRCETSGRFAVELDLTRLLKGTSAEVNAQREFLINYLSSALRVQRMKFVAQRQSSKRSKAAQPSAASLQIESVGLVQIVENVVLKHGTADVLIVSFSRDPRRLFSLAAADLLPSAMNHTGTTELQGADNGDSSAEAIVSLQPDVLQALSRASSPRKLCAYLSLELMKKRSERALDSQEHPERFWRGRALGARELSKLHKEQLARAQAFYDHGILSWENEAPRERVRHLMGRAPKQADSGIVHCWRMSQHALDAVQFERALSGVLQDGPAVALESSVIDAAPVALVESSANAASSRIAPVQQAVLATNVQRAERVVSFTDSRSLQNENVGRPAAAEKTVNQSKSSDSVSKADVWSDDDFLMCVAEFYESLTPLQQQAFERERRKMSPEQFKRYVTPALMRLKNKD